MEMPPGSGEQSPNSLQNPPGVSSGPPPSVSPPRSPLVLVVVVLVVALMLYFGYHQARRTGSSAPRIGQSPVAPDFSLASFDRPSMRPSDLHAKALMLKLPATWCGPLNIEIPSYAHLS